MNTAYLYGYPCHVLEDAIIDEFMEHSKDITSITTYIIINSR